MIITSLILFFARKLFGGVKGLLLFLALCFAPGCIVIVKDPLATDGKPSIAEHASKPAKRRHKRASNRERIAADNAATDRLLDAARK